MESAIIDLDGTLSDNSHRDHLIKGEDKKWREYLQKASEDTVNEKVKKFVQNISEEYRVVILTLRSDEVREETISWLKKHEISFEKLIMLPEGCWNVSDSDFKKDRLEEIEDPTIAIDNKQSNCKMFEKEGLEVYNVENSSPVEFQS